eukprot:scaffold18264_cov67-Phaeocystis_antarctica.AAC.3
MSTPAPTHAPCTQATTGTESASIASKACCISMTLRRMRRADLAVSAPWSLPDPNSLMSMPPQKEALSPPVSSTTRSVSSDCRLAKHARSSDHITQLIALRFLGRFSSTSSTCPSSSSQESRSVSNCGGLASTMRCVLRRTACERRGRSTSSSARPPNRG